METPACSRKGTTGWNVAANCRPASLWQAGGQAWQLCFKQCFGAGGGRAVQRQERRRQRTSGRQLDAGMCITCTPRSARAPPSGSSCRLRAAVVGRCGCRRAGGVAGLLSLLELSRLLQIKPIAAWRGFAFGRHASSAVLASKHSRSLCQSDHIAGKR